MKFIFFTLFSFIMSLAYAENHDHHAGHSPISGKQVSINKQFKPTKDLKIRMERILNHVNEVSKKKEDIKSVKDYGNKISDTVNDIFKTCKLEPDADEAIHPTLGLILDGAEDLKNGKYESGHKKIHEALEKYHKIFKDN